MTTYSQLDPKWKDVKLGTSNVTIGGYGCTITSIGMILDETPISVNDRMKAVGGFAEGNLVIWDKIKEAFPNKVESIRRAWTYNNDDVKANIPCVVQVDGTPIGAPMHFVVYKGEQKLLDPWGGVERSTSYYIPQSYCVIKLKPFVQPTQPVDDCPAKLAEKTKLETELRGEIDKKQARIDALTNTNDTLSKQNLALQTDLQSEKDHAKVTLDAELSKQRTDMLMTSETEKKALQQDFEKKLEEAKKANPEKIVEKETPLSKRFSSAKWTVKRKAILEILMA